eukprot:GFYU01031480.1.p1 GENE.GFYU01031480.1~~GFYU01031480.1.p1  ORF type:complete len:116 (+),score=18.69 GFYU01031480.1:3-350(+)
MCVSVNAVHMDESVWGEHPEVFNPENFSKDNMDKRPRCAFMAFSKGPRMCPGHPLSLIECKTMLVAIFQLYRVEVDPSCNITPICKYMSWSTTGIHLKAVRRRHPLPPQDPQPSQ